MREKINKYFPSNCLVLVVWYLFEELQNKIGRNEDSRKENSVLFSYVAVSISVVLDFNLFLVLSCLCSVQVAVWIKKMFYRIIDYITSLKFLNI